MAKTVTSTRRLVHNTFFNVLMLMSNAIVGFLLIGFFIGRLGQARYGVWVLIGELFRYRMLLGLGLNSAINRRIPMYLAKDDEDGIRRVVSTALFFFTIIAVVLVLLSVLFAAKVGDWFKIDAELVRAASVLVLVVGIGFAISTPLQLTTAVLSGLQRYDMVSITTVIVLTIRTVLTVVLLLQGYGLLTLGLIYGISEIVARGVQHILARRLLPRGYASWRYVDRALLKEMLFYGINTFLYAMGALIIFRASITITGIFLGSEEVTQLGTAAAGLLLLWTGMEAFTAAVKPAVSDLDTRDDHAKVRQIAFLTQKYSLLIIIPASLFLGVMGREFLTVWVGAKFGDPAVVRSMASILTVLTVGYFFILSQHSNFLVLAGRGEHKVFGVLTAVEALLCVCVAVVAVHVFKLGLLGIAWSNLIPMTLVAGVIIPIYFNRKMKISAWDSITHVWWPALLGGVPSLVIVCAWKYFAPPASWGEILAVVAAMGGATLGFAWFVSLDGGERQRLLQVLRRGRDKPPAEGGDVPAMQ
jgi:O-antigen/teichoic acid export membrane protein